MAYFALKINEIITFAFHVIYTEQRENGDWLCGAAVAEVRSAARTARLYEATR